MSTNDITGDRLVSKANSKAFDENFDRIFGKKSVPNGDMYMIRESEVSMQLDTLVEQGKCEHDWCSDGDPGPADAMTLTCSRCGKEQAALPVGYTAEELERDNPYNQWMYEK